MEDFNYALLFKNLKLPRNVTNFTYFITKATFILTDYQYRCYQVLIGLYGYSYKKGGTCLMKIGILSMQRVVNYGSFLQAFAMKEILKNLGHECYFIDIKAGRKINKENSFNKPENKIKFILKRLDRHIIKRIKHRSFSRLRTNRFYNEFFPILGISKEPSYISNYDAVLIGSDEVFNCTQDAKWGFAKTLLGEGLKSDNIISYAAGETHYRKVLLE